MVTREQMVEQSVQDFLREQLFVVRGYPTEDVELLDSFPYNRFDGPLAKTYVAAGFDFTDQGRAIELGSDLILRTYTLEFFVFGHDPLYGKNVASVVMHTLEDGNIPLKDISKTGAPQIDVLTLVTVSKDRVPMEDPKPHEENLWLVTAKVDDEYFMSLV
jgi:hypothetical protein